MENYLDPIRDLILNGEKRGDRTGVGTMSKFGSMTRYNLEDEFPLLTTKRVFWRGVVEELLFFLKGCTDERKLSEKKVTIWKANSDAWHGKQVTKEKLMKEEMEKLKEEEREIYSELQALNNEEDQERKKKSVERETLYKTLSSLQKKLTQLKQYRPHIDGDLGPIYGWQWLHFGAKYIDCDTDYTGQGFNQIEYVINEIKNNPNSRQIFLSAWNPADLFLMALPPCHVSYQFRVSNGRLSCMMTQRSVDTILGQPFNIASASLLTCMLAHVCGLKPGELVHSLGDYHIYLNHIEGAKIQLDRTPVKFPKLKIEVPEGKEIKCIQDFEFDYFKIIDYDPAPAIKFDMAV
jgi:thymidylate synthase